MAMAMKDMTPKESQAHGEPGPKQPAYGEYLDYGDGVRIRQRPIPADGYSESADYVSYDDFPPFHPDDIAAVRKRVHDQQVAAGLLPADAPEDFVLPKGWNEQGLPWWFPPDFVAGQIKSEGRVVGQLRLSGDGDPARTPDGTPVALAWDYFGHERPQMVTRESIEEEFGYRITEFSKPTLIPPPKRLWTEPQMARMRFGFKAQEMEQKWHAFMEGDRAFIARSWTGYLAYQTQFARVPGGWKMTEALVEADLDRYYRRHDAYESTLLECLLFEGLLAKHDEQLQKREFKEFSKSIEGPRLVITKAKGPPLPIEKPGYSVKHGKLADQHPLQREAYDAAFAKGYEAATKALAKGRTPQDVYYSAHRHEEKALMTVGIESSQHAGLAKGAKVAAYQHHLE